VTSGRGLAVSAKAYVGLVMLAGVCLLGFLPVRLPEEQGLTYFLLLAGVCIAAALTQILKVEGSTAKTSYNLGLVVFGFTLVVLGPSSAMIVVVFACLVDWAWHRYLWFIQIFNIATLIVGLSAGGIVYRTILDGHSTLSIRGAAGAVAAAAVFVLLNHLMVGLAIVFSRQESFSDSGVLGRLPLLMDATLFATGAAAGMLWLVNPWASSLLLIPLYMLYVTLRVPSLERQATTDSKTGLLNARYFEEALEKELIRANRFERPLTVVVGDLDLLRNINNTYGHLAGDAVLVGVARILKESFRDYDIIARFGGEEFTVLMPETTLANAVPRIERIRRAIEAATFEAPSSGHLVRATMSFGVVQRTQSDATPKGLLHEADLALYRAKLEGRNLVRIAETSPATSPMDLVFAGVGGSALSLDDICLPSAGAGEYQAPEGERSDVLVCPGDQGSTGAGGKAKTHGAESSSGAGVPAKWRLAGLVAAVVVCAAGAAVASLLFGSWPALDWYRIAVFTAIAVAAETLAVEIYIRDTSVSTASAPFVAAAMLFGPTAAVVVSAAVAASAMIRHRSSPSHFLFNAGADVLAGLVAAWLVKLAGYEVAASISWGYLGLCVAALAMMFCITTVLVAAAMAFSAGSRIEDVWNERFRWLFPYYLGLGVITFAIILGFVHAGYLGALVVVAPLVLVRYGEKQYVSKTKRLVVALQKSNETLQEHSREISELNEGLLGALAKAVDLRDPFVLGHSEYVSHYAVLIAREMKLPQERIELVRKAGLLHDIGKLGVADEILFKPGRLNEAEYEKIKTHPWLAEELLGVCPSLGSLAKIVLYHHERYDGRGYPAGLRGEEIPLESRILAVADTVEAMASERPYRHDSSVHAIMQELERNAGEQFDARVVAALYAIVEREGEQIIVNSAAQVRARHETSAHVAGERGLREWERKEEGPLENAAGKAGRRARGGAKPKEPLSAGPLAAADS
jgi:diguanylate cyclase (GGDEF)-like protein